MSNVAADDAVFLAADTAVLGCSQKTCLVCRQGYLQQICLANSSLPAKAASHYFSLGKSPAPICDTTARQIVDDVRYILCNLCPKMLRVGASRVTRNGSAMQRAAAKCARLPLPRHPPKRPPTHTPSHPKLPPTQTHLPTNHPRTTHPASRKEARKGRQPPPLPLYD